MRDHVYARRSADETTRDLLFDFYFGLRAAGQNVWLGGNAAPGRPLTSAGYDGETGIVKIVQKQGDLEATQYFFAPFGVAAPVVVAIAEVKNTGASVGRRRGPVLPAQLPRRRRRERHRQRVHHLDQRRLRGARRHPPAPRAPPRRDHAPRRLAAESLWPRRRWRPARRRRQLGEPTDAVSGFEWDLTGLAPGETRTFGVVFAYEGGGNRATIDAALVPLAD